jgi:hypothetical protein
MEILDRTALPGAQVPDYRIIAVLLIVLQPIMWVFYIQHWPFGLLMNYTFSAAALAFFLHWFFKFTLSLWFKIAFALVLIKPILIITEAIELLMNGKSVLYGHYLFVITFVVVFTFFSLYTYLMRKKKREE